MATTSYGYLWTIYNNCYWKSMHYQRGIQKISVPYPDRISTCHVTVPETSRLRPHVMEYGKDQMMAVVWKVM
uniref:Uncharacterized protein n=1 Tax=Caenorhabditis japonica TaxID=281687 RepID=A0A8R1EWJ0_CAEJA